MNFSFFFLLARDSQGDDDDDDDYNKARQFVTKSKFKLGKVNTLITVHIKVRWRQGYVLGRWLSFLGSKKEA